MANGYWQKILRVDLTSGSITTEAIPEEDLKNYIGGAGLGAEILRRELPGKINAYESRNKVIFGTGLFQGPAVPGGAKFSIVGISPVTGTYADTAAGASFGPSLKDAGYDVLIVEGASDKPVYLQIIDDDVQIKDAASIWGKDTYDSIDAIHAETDDMKLSVAAIGPAGEKKVAIACVVIDKHSFAGRCGLGAVMGSKNLKAVAVRGTQKVPLHDPEKANELMKRFQKEIFATTKENEFRLHGTPGLCETAEGLGDMPIKNWDGDTWPEGAKRLGGESYTNSLNAKPLPCKYCPVGCHRDITVEEPAELAQKGIGPEYETLGLMGTNLMIDDPKVVAWANSLANKLGIDTISSGAMVGVAMECYEKGWLTLEDTDGLALNWGDSKAFFSLIEQIGNREGFGAIFAEGTLAAAQKIHPEAPDCVAHNKGLDYPAHDPRTCISLAPTYATGTRGACHFRGPCEDVEMGGFFIPEAGVEEGMFKFFERANQGMLAAKCQDLGALINSMVLCMFMVDGGAWSMTHVTELFNAITGWDYTVDDLMTAGERIFTVQRLLNIRDGYDGATDVLPKKMLKVAQEGFRAGKEIPFKELMTDYYRVRGWDDNGIPTSQTLGRLGLK